MSKPTVTSPRGAVAVDAAGILADLRELIHSARHRVATVANAEQPLLYWRLGRRILTENLTEGPAEYGKKILATLSQELVAEFGSGFSYSALNRMARFAELFPDEEIVVSLLQDLGWVQFLAFPAQRIVSTLSAQFRSIPFRNDINYKYHSDRFRFSTHCATDFHPGSEVTNHGANQCSGGTP
jgi:hypothetical protein